MAKIAAFPIEMDDGDGTSTLLIGVDCVVYNVADEADEDTVTTDADGYFPETTVTGSAGDLFRIRIENYEGKAGYYEVQSVA